MSATSEIKEFFKNQTIFITGGTGFLGKVLIEKLLRECSDLSKIHILVRPKRDKTPQQRLDELFDSPCFEAVKRKNVDLISKVSLVHGDCQKPYLGLGNQDMDILRKETTCVIHAAANVKFDQSFKEASAFVKATKDLIELAKEMPNLKSFVFVSTAFSNCTRFEIREQFYKSPMSPDGLLQLTGYLDDHVLEQITPRLLDKYPNTYVYVKNIIEDLVKSAGTTLPISVVRPAIVTSSAAEPLPGWIDNFYGLSGVMAGAALGVIRTVHAEPHFPAKAVPVDFVSNCVLAAAWKASQNSATVIYHMTPEEKNQITWDEVRQSFQNLWWERAPVNAVWYNHFIIQSNEFFLNLNFFFFQTLPAFVVDSVLFITGQSTFALKKSQKIRQTLHLLSYFSTGRWFFHNDNTKKLWSEMTDEDRRLFNFNLETLNWRQCMDDAATGLRQYLLNENPSTIPKGRRRIKLLFVAHYTILALFWYLMFKSITLLRYLYGVLSRRCKTQYLNLFH